MTNDTKMLVAFDFDHTVSGNRCTPENQAVLRHFLN
jgi:hypothetical protein